MKKYLLLCLLIIAAFSVQAQEKDTDHVCSGDACCAATPKYAPQKGDFTAAILFGRGAYLNGGLVVPSSDGAVPGDAPYANDVSANNNDITNMIGVEGKYFIGKKFALTLSGGAILRNTPSEIGFPEVTDVNGVVIFPGYETVVANERIDMNVSLGGQWMLKAKNERMVPYLGFALPYDYARWSVFDPTLETGDNGLVTATDLGARHVDIAAFGIQAVAGIDYYIAQDLFFGIDVKPISYSYAVSLKNPGPGLQELQAETDTVSFFAQFSFKLGFKF